MLFDHEGGRFSAGAGADADSTFLVFDLDNHRRHARYAP
jgi:hypothetical protein